MKSLLQIALFIYAQSLPAQVYKCTSSSGKVFYQDTACAIENKSETININRFDPKKIESAQKKLRNYLDKREEQQNKITENRLKERQINALERNAKATEDLAQANWYQGNLLQQRYNYYRPDGYFYLPIYTKPNAHKKGKYNQTTPSIKPPEQVDSYSEVKSPRNMLIKR